MDIDFLLAEIERLRGLVVKVAVAIASADEE